MSPWTLALRNVTRNRRRSFLTGAVVAFGFAAFALAGGFMAQTFAGLREGTIRGGTGHIQFARAETFEGAEEASLEHGVVGSDRAAAVLRRDPAVEAVLPRIDFVGLLSNGARSVPYLGIGLDPAAEALVMESRSTVVAGRWLDASDADGVVLGTGLARALGLATGGHATLFSTTPDGVLNAVDVTVVGLADVSVKELNDRYLATPVPVAEKLLMASGTVSKLVVMLKPGADEEAVRLRLSAALSATGLALESRSWRQLGAFYAQVRLLYIGIFGFMGIVLVVVVLLACANTMTMATTERIREIGTLRAIGTPPAGIRRMFVAEGVLLALFGCAAGAVFALVVRAVLNASGIRLPPPPGATHGMPIHVAFFPITYGAGFLAMLATLALASYFPARRASRVPIVEALTHV
jgi:putative ABC transport system permease protein